MSEQAEVVEVAQEEAKSNGGLMDILSAAAETHIKGKNSPEAKPEVKAEKPEIKEEKQEVIEKAPEQKADPVIEPEAKKETEVVIPEGYIPSAELDKIRAEMDAMKSRITSYESDPYLKELLGIRDKGGAITTTLLKEAFEEYDKIDTSNIQVAYDLMKRSFIESGMSEKEASLQLKQDFAPLLEKTPDEQSDEYQLAEAKLTRLASQYIAKKKENQLNLKTIPQPSTNKEDVAREIEAHYTAKYNEKKQMLESAATEMLASRKNVELSFTFKNEKNEPIDAKISADITDEIRKELKSAMSNPVIMDAVAQFVDFKQPGEKVNEDILHRVLLLCKPKLYASLIAGEAAAQGGAGVLKGIKPAVKHEQNGVIKGVDPAKYDLNTVMGRLEYEAAKAQARKQQV